MVKACKFDRALLARFDGKDSNGFGMRESGRAEKDPCGEQGGKKGKNVASGHGVSIPHRKMEMTEMTDLAEAIDFLGRVSGERPIGLTIDIPDI